jgi:uncharacterized protein YcbX
MRVLELWRYPVKSMGGERVESAEVRQTGLVGDRGWGLVDNETGKVLTARREPRLLFAQARLRAEEEVEITLPDGRCGASSDALSDWLGHDVTLTRAGSVGGIYENPVDVESESDWRSWQGPPDAWHDAARVSIVSTGSIGTWDVRRFRPNILIDGDGEEGLVGHLVGLGSALLTVTQRLGRCVMVTRAQPGIDRDKQVLRTIHDKTDNCLAIGAVAARVGVISVGDPLQDMGPAPDGH